MLKKIFIGSFGLGLNIVIYVLVILAAIRMVTFSYNFSYEVFGNVAVVEEAQAENAATVAVQIPEGASTEEIAGVLKDKGLINYKQAFVLHTLISQYNGLIKPGSYELSPAMTMDDMLAVICGMSSES